MSSTRVPLILGASTYGNPEAKGSYTCVKDLAICQKMINIFTVEHKNRFIDTSRAYGGGASEEYLAKLDLHSGQIDTKVLPQDVGNLKAETVEKSLRRSIEVLGEKNKIRTFYFHSPDRNTPLEESLAAVDKLHKEGLFEEFGLSNYAAFEVARTICKERGWVLPTVYQGRYNIISRGSEAELFPALRMFNIRFAAWSPLAGGLLAGNIPSKEAPLEEGSRYDPDSGVGQLMRRIFLSGTEMGAVQVLNAIIKQHNLTPAEVALRWLQHHSELTPNDYVVIGGSKPEQVESNCVDSEKGPLPQEIVEAAEAAGMVAKARSSGYFSPFVKLS